MNSKISDKDKKDWENFLSNDENLPNKDLNLKEKKIVSGNPDKTKMIYYTWVFSRDLRSNNPHWQLIDILT